MKEMIEKCAQAKDDELVRELKFMVERERRNLAAVLVVLGEYGWRRLYRDEGYYSLFEYCMRVLRYDESAAYRHITAARVMRQYPLGLPLVESGELTLTSILILSPVLTAENHETMFKEARGKSRRELETIVAAKNPLPPRGDSVRILPTPPPAWTSRLPSSPPPAEPGEGTTGLPAGGDDMGVLAISTPREWQAVMPLTIDRVRIGFDAAVALSRLLDRAKQLLRHKYPEGRIEDVVREALELFLDRKDPQRRLQLKAPPGLAVAENDQGPRPPRFLRDLKAGRYVPAWVKRAVWERDGGRCAWRFADGTVCGSRDWLEYDHIRPVTKGGSSDRPRNVRLLCRLHNEKAATAAGICEDGRYAGPASPSRSWLPKAGVSAPACAGSSSGASARPDGGGSA